MNMTLDYYNKNASSYVMDTLGVEFSEVQSKFLSYIPKGGLILDFGCGSGRDSKCFLDKGYQVDPVDGSAEFCKIASDITGTRVRQMLFKDLEAETLYDGIWACASVLHLSKEELADVFSKMIRALKDGAYIYTSFKYGTFEGERNGRYFTDFTIDAFRDFLEKFPDLEIEEYWISGDVRPGRQEEAWLNLIMKKSPGEV